jgi:hypothetical protein
MKQGKERDNLEVRSRRRRESLAVFQHAGPMDNAVKASNRKGVILENFVNDGSRGQGGHQHLLRSRQKVVQRVKSKIMSRIRIRITKASRRIESRPWSSSNS